MIAVRRTQAERRASTIRKILDAATEVLIERGYAHAAIQEIATRAELSQGAIFRHFATREALMVAVAEDVGEKLLARFRRAFQRVDGDRLESAIGLVREHCHSRVNQAWYELATASRTDAELRKALRPIGDRYYRDIEALARELLPDVAEALGERFPLVVDTIIAIFDGEAVHRAIGGRRSALEDGRVALLAALFGAVVKR